MGRPVAAAVYNERVAIAYVPYASQYRAACLALFDENCPEYFAENERADYLAFLAGSPTGYRVCLLNERVVGAFGVIDTGGAGRRRLNWILVSRGAQGRGIGRGLMSEAVRIAKGEGAAHVDIAASHKSAPFFAKFGARELRRLADGWGHGMHRVDMELQVAEIPANVIFSAPGGRIVLPTLVLIGRADGGHLIVNPPRAVWERSELTRDELTQWSLLVAATGRAMIDVLPQLDGGCVNYWEAGNWALNDLADPPGPKDPRIHRVVHAHLLGRSRSAMDPSWQWGEAPRFPSFVDRLTWAARFDPLTPSECRVVADRTATLLRDQYGVET